jgi:glutathione-specific gamma-glutamylcyclotransferase
VTLALTAELVAKAHRIIADPGPSPGSVRLTDEDYIRLVEQLLRGYEPGTGFWVFAYGSLIWKPVFTALEERLAVAPGWHRAFALRLTRWRGSPDQPGLMLGLDRGGSCRGIAYRLPEAGLAETVAVLLRREMSAKPATNVPRWIKLRTSGGPLPALAFTLNRAGPAYTGKLLSEEIVESLASAVGHGGSCAEYLYNTVTHLEARGIRDSTLWRLQYLVAERLREATGQHP